MVDTRILTVDDPQAIAAAKQTIDQGGVIAFPTDTIYGVAVDAFNSQAIKALYAAKQRPDEKALPVLIGDAHQLTQLIQHTDQRLHRIAAAFWPGPLTLILPKKIGVPAELSPYPTIGVRMPNLVFTLALLRETGPLATTSANLSRGPNPVDAASVISQLGEHIDLLLDGGSTPGPTASTVADLTGPVIQILRAGPISLAELQSIADPG
ncbi:MAG: threonylcarbamoyl-AMP synthase [Chloroflexi bacterium]|nr:threonylcarbamoyl-AMP synthase [Chloroflexota bacterium]